MAAVTSAVVGIASGVAGAGMSFAQASKAKNAANVAKQDSKRLMAEAKIMAEKNFYENLNVPVGAYERQREENMASGSAAVQALQEGDARGLAGGVGQVNQAQSAASEGLRNDLGQALYDNDKMKAEAKDNINQNLVAANIGEAKDASAEANYQQQLGASSMKSGVSSALGAVGSAASLVPLYGKGRAAKDAKSIFGGDAGAQFKSRGIGEDRGLNMLSGLDKGTLKKIRKGGSFDFDTLFGKGILNTRTGNQIYESEPGFFDMKDDD